MASSYKVPDLVRIQTLANIVSNRAQWAYVTEPAVVDTIANILAQTAKLLGDIRPYAKIVCPSGYCRDQDACIPCDAPRSTGVPRRRTGRAAALLASDGARRKKSANGRRRANVGARPGR
jgi:hypothetical protein